MSVRALSEKLAHAGRCFWRLVRLLPWVKWRLFYEGEKRERLRIAEEKWALKEELRLATLGRCTCSDCGRTVNNAWRDLDGRHCLTCLAKQRDDARKALSPNVKDEPRRP